MKTKSEIAGSQKCKAENKRRVRARREGRKPTDRTPRQCSVCGEPFVPHQFNQTTCQNFHCKAESKKLAAIRRYHAKQSATAETCPICQRYYVSKFDGQKTCGDARCASMLRIQNAPKETKACRFCRTEFQTRLNSGRVFCSDECRENWKDEQRLMANAEHMECPFQSMHTMVHGISSWDCPEMDPMTNRMEAGVWIETNENGEVEGRGPLNMI